MFLNKALDSEPDIIIDDGFFNKSNFLIFKKNIEQISTTEKILDNFFDVHELFEKILSYKKLQEIPINHTKNNLRQKI